MNSSLQNLKRSFLGRPDDAFSVMRQQGIGISNENLAKIPVSLDYLSGKDSNGDGLPDAFKETLGLDINSADSNGEGYDDLTELLYGYDPLGPGRLVHDLNFAKSQAGKIFLQVENNGEAWCVNPVDIKRYFLGRPLDAFNKMRNLGLGITNRDLELLTVESGSSIKLKEIIDCGSIEYSDMVYLMFGDEDDYFDNLMSDHSKNSLICINQAMIECLPAKFKINSSEINPIFPDDKDFSTPAMFLIVEGEEDNNICKINNYSIPKQAILNHYTTNGNSFIFT